jgi:hypothetical protein
LLPALHRFRAREFAHHSALPVVDGDGYLAGFGESEWNLSGNGEITEKEEGE